MLYMKLILTIVVPYVFTVTLFISVLISHIIMSYYYVVISHSVIGVAINALYYTVIIHSVIWGYSNDGEQ